MSGSSPAINAGDGIFGNSVNTDTFDIVGNSRFDGIIDMEAYEKKLCYEHLILGLADSPMSGLYKANQTITLIGSVEILSGAAIEFNAPIVELGALMNLGSGATVIVKCDGCN